MADELLDDIERRCRNDESPWPIIAMPIDQMLTIIDDSRQLRRDNDRMRTSLRVIVRDLGARFARRAEEGLDYDTLAWEAEQAYAGACWALEIPLPDASSKDLLDHFHSCPKCWRLWKCDYQADVQTLERECYSCIEDRAIAQAEAKLADGGIQ